MKPKISTMRSFSFIFLCLLSVISFMGVKLYAQTAQPAQKTGINISFAQNKFSPVNLSYKIIDAPNKTFGYDIYAGNKMVIHQPSIPALPGNEGFKTKEDAIKVAQLVIQKIEKGEMPPTVTIEEMKKLNAIK